MSPSGRFPNVARKCCRPSKKEFTRTTGPVEGVNEKLGSIGGGPGGWVSGTEAGVGPVGADSVGGTAGPGALVLSGPDAGAALLACGVPPEGGDEDDAPAVASSLDWLDSGECDCA